MIVFGWTLRGLTNGFLKLWLAVLVFQPLALFIVSSQCFSLFKYFYDNALTELVNHYANRTLIVSGTKDYT